MPTPPGRRSAERPTAASQDGPAPTADVGGPTAGAQPAAAPATAAAGRGIRPLARLRHIALSIERLAVEGVASGVVRGAAGELRAGLPADFDERLARLLERALVAVEAASGDGAMSVRSWPRRTAEEIVRGVVEEVRRLVPELRPATQELLKRLQIWFEQSTAEAAARAELLRAPGNRARAATAGAFSGAVDQLVLALPVLGDPAAELAEKIGRGLVRGFAAELGLSLRAAGRSPAARALACGAVVLLLLYRGRR